jgi:hypothetical protein
MGGLKKRQNIDILCVYSHSPEQNAVITPKKNPLTGSFKEKREDKEKRDVSIYIKTKEWSPDVNFLRFVTLFI